MTDKHPDQPHAAVGAKAERPDAGIPPIPDGPAGSVAVTRKRPTPPVARVPATPKGGSKVKGAALIPDLISTPSIAAEHFYWVGVLPDCPVERISVGGIAFAKQTVNLVAPVSGGDMERHPVPGQICIVTEGQMKALRRRLPYTLIRNLGDQVIQEEPGTGENKGSAHAIRRGAVIKAPSPEDIAARATMEGMRPMPGYRPHEGDTPAAQWLYMQFCEDQKAPVAGGPLPPPLSETGLYWPDKIDW